MASAKPYSIAIVGGGISGLTLAIALLQHDIPTTIYESAAHFNEIGAGVYFGPNAVRAMRDISPTILDAFDKCRTANDTKTNSWFTVRVGDARRADKDGSVSGSARVGDALYDVELDVEGAAEGAAGGGGVYRAHFLDELVKAVPESAAQFGKKLVDLRTEGDSVVCVFADGSEARHDAVIGCDGIKSATRKWVLGKDDPTSEAVFSGKYAYRGLIPMEEAVEMLGDDVARNSNFFYGYHGHLLTFPVEQGKTMNGTTHPFCMCYLIR